MYVSKGLNEIRCQHANKIKFVKEIGRKIQEKTGNKNAIQAISMTVQRGNATSIMGTLGPLRKLKEFFDGISPREEESQMTLNLITLYN